MRNITENSGGLRPVWSRNHITRSHVSALHSLLLLHVHSGSPHGDEIAVEVSGAWHPHTSKSQWKEQDFQLAPSDEKFPRSSSHLLFACHWLTWDIFSSHLSCWPPRSLTGFSWEHYFKKSFAPKSLDKQPLVAETSLRYKWIQWKPLSGYPIRPELIFSFFTSLQKLAFHSLNRTHIFSNTHLPRFCTAYRLTQPPASLIPLQSLPCALWKHPSTTNCPFPITCLDFCYVTASAETWFIPKGAISLSSLFPSEEGTHFSHSLTLESADKAGNLLVRERSFQTITSVTLVLLDFTVTIEISSEVTLLLHRRALRECQLY